MKSSGRALRLSIFVSETDHWHHRPVYGEIVHRAHKAGLAGATVIRGVEGYGAASCIHTAHLFQLSEALPMMIVITDAENRIREFLPKLTELDISGLVTLEEVEIIHYSRPERTHTHWWSPR